MKKNRQELISLMSDKTMKCKDIAKLLSVKTSTVKVWRCKIGVDIPDIKLELLKHKV